jgi:Flp pilus assembly protein TadG
MEQPTKPAFSSATDGSVLVEAALVIPLLLAFVFGVEEYGRLFLSQTALQRAAYVAARCGAVYDPNLAATATTTCSDASSTQAYAKGQLWGLLNSTSVTFTPTFSSTCSTAGISSASVTVTASYPFSFIVNLPALLSSSGSSPSLSLTASAKYTVQC